MMNSELDESHGNRFIGGKQIIVSPINRWFSILIPLIYSLDPLYPELMEVGTNQREHTRTESRTLHSQMRSWRRKTGSGDMGLCVCFYVGRNRQSSKRDPNDHGS
mmetsp:Transcript_14460/g.29563  ORF Transcript_14460/g.29563 Transcript_14460/m.29563 type:complete len:105 (+) Transcript_14460:434-748(+)